MCDDTADCVHGECLGGYCQCAPNWTGPWCEKPSEKPLLEFDVVPTPTPAATIHHFNLSRPLNASRTNVSKKAVGEFENSVAVAPEGSGSGKSGSGRLGVSVVLVGIVGVLAVFAR